MRDGSQGWESEILHAEHAKSLGSQIICGRERFALRERPRGGVIGTDLGGCCLWKAGAIESDLGDAQNKLGRPA